MPLLWVEILVFEIYMYHMILYRTRYARMAYIYKTHHHNS